MKKEEIKKLLDQFEAAANIVEGIECWSARELQLLLGYAKWDNFINNVVVKAKETCKHAGENVLEHFPDVGKMMSIGKGAEIQIDDILLTRYACYFAVQTRKAEIIEQRLWDYERVKVREKLSKTEKQLSGILYERGIDSKSFAIICSKGDQALFNMNTQMLKKKMGVPSGRPVADFLPTVSIKAEDLAVEMTNINVQTKYLYGQSPIEKEHVDNNSAVRDILLKRGIRPEQLSLGEDVKKVQKRIDNEDKKVLKKSNPES